MRQKLHRHRPIRPPPPVAPPPPPAPGPPAPPPGDTDAEAPASIAPLAPGPWWSCSRRRCRRHRWPRCRQAPTATRCQRWPYRWRSGSRWNRSHRSRHRHRSLRCQQATTATRCQDRPYHWRSGSRWNRLRRSLHRHRWPCCRQATTATRYRGWLYHWRSGSRSNRSRRAWHRRRSPCAGRRRQRRDTEAGCTAGARARGRAVRADAASAPMAALPAGADSDEIPRLAVPLALGLAVEPLAPSVASAPIAVLPRAPTATRYRGWLYRWRSGSRWNRSRRVLHGTDRRAASGADNDEMPRLAAPLALGLAVEPLAPSAASASMAVLPARDRRGPATRLAAETTEC